MNAAVKQVEQVEIKRQQRKLVKKSVVKKRKSVYSFHTLLSLVCAGAFVLLVGQLYLDAKINQLHYETETMKLNIDKQTVKNEELYAKIAELSTYTRAMEIAKANGLETYDNVISLGE